MSQLWSSWRCCFRCRAGGRRRPRGAGEGRGGSKPRPRVVDEAEADSFPNGDSRSHAQTNSHLATLRRRAETLRRFGLWSWRWNATWMLRTFAAGIGRSSIAGASTPSEPGDVGGRWRQLHDRGPINRFELGSGDLQALEDLLKELRIFQVPSALGHKGSDVVTEHRTASSPPRARLRWGRQRDRPRRADAHGSPARSPRTGDGHG